MPTKQPVPPPKFNIGDRVAYRSTVYTVQNRQYKFDVWCYYLEEYGVSDPDRLADVKEQLLMPAKLQVPPKFKVGDRVVEVGTMEVYEVDSMFWHPKNKWTYILFRYLPHAPGGVPTKDVIYDVLETSLVPDEPIQLAPQNPLFKLTDIVVYKGEQFRITLIQYEFSTKTFLYDLQTKEPNSLGSYATCRAIAENEIQGDTNFETELSDDLRVIEQPSKFKIDDYVKYKGYTCQVVMLCYNDERKEYQYEIKTHPKGHTHYYRINESELSSGGLYGLPLDNQTVTNNQGGKQSFVSARFDCIPPVVLRLLAQCLGFGVRKYGDTNYQNISMQDQLNHAMNHINEWNRGDRSEPHLVNAMARLTFALWHAVDQKQQPDTYIHPDEKQS